MPAVPAPLALSLFYLTSFAVLGAYLPFFNLYLETLGFSGLQIGVASALLPLCSTIAPAPGGLLADRSGRRRELAALSTLLALLAFSLLLLARSFAGVLLAVAAYAALRAPALPLVEASAMEVSEAGGPHYGRMRVWGSLGFIAVSLLSGPAVRSRGERAVLGLIIALLALNAASALLLPPGRRRPAAGARRAAGLAGRLRRPETLLFLGACVLMQASHAPYYVFFSIHLQDRGYRPEVIGLYWALAVGCEVFAMLRMPAILGRLGTLPTIAACLLLAALRWGIGSATAAPLPLALAQALHAATFAAFHVAAVTHTHRLFGEDLRASGQAVYGSATYGAGNVLGMLLSGALVERIGVPLLFAWAAGAALAGALLVTVAALRGRARGPGYNGRRP